MSHLSFTKEERVSLSSVKSEILWFE